MGWNPYSRMIELFEDEWARVSLLESDGDLTVLCFTGVGHGMGAINIQREEFVGTGSSFGSMIFITDKTRSWGNALNVERICDLIAPYVAGRELHALGNSMGGFLAVVFSSFLKLQTCVAFVPQFSVKNDIVPEERRWRNFRAQIKAFRFPSLEGHFVPECEYFLFSGAEESERPHWSQFPRLSNVRNIVVEECGHDLAGDLKATGLLYPVIADCFNRRNPVKTINTVLHCTDRNAA